MLMSLKLLCFTYISCITFNAFALGISNRSGLNFGSLIGGDPSKTIVPDIQETEFNASFEVKGKKNTVYTIILPQSMILSNGAQAELTVNNFTSYPAEGNNGQTDVNGKQKVYVGATLQAIPNLQPSGNYTGSFVVEIISQ